MKNFFLIACVYCALFLMLTPFSKISVIKLQADDKLKSAQSYQLKEKEILSYLESYKGQWLWQTPLKELAKAVSAMYLEADVYTARRFPSRLIVILKKKDTALLLLREGEFFYSVSYKGDIGAKKSLGESLDFPILRGDVFWSDSRLRKRALSVFLSIPKNSRRAFAPQNISEISYNKANDSLFFYLMPGHFIVELAERASLKKAQNIDFVLNYLTQRKAQGKLIDARMDKKIIVKNQN